MATTINFTFTGIKETALIKLATANGMAPSEYIETSTTIYLENQVRDYYKSKFSDLTTLEMIAMFGDFE
jgi:hypothetical protein